jgi:hypothetical protein
MFPVGRFLATGVCLVALAGPAFAQQALKGRWEGAAPLRKIVANNSFAQSCLPALARATARLNAVGAKFTLTYSNPSWTTYSHASAPNGYANTIVEAGSVSVPGRIAEVGYGYKTVAPTATVSGIPYFTFADMIVNRDVLLYASGTAGGQCHCPASSGAAVPSQRYDMEYTFTHELSHVAGLGHNPTSGCLMYETQNLAAGTPAFCADESGMLLNVYGRR